MSRTVPVQRVCDLVFGKQIKSSFFIVDVKKKSSSKKDLKKGEDRNFSFPSVPHCATAKKCPRGKCNQNIKTAQKEEKGDKMCDPGPPCSTPTPYTPSCYPPFSPCGPCPPCGPCGGCAVPPYTYGAPCGYPGPHPGPPGCPVPGYGECRHAQHDYFHSMENYHK